MTLLRDVELVGLLVGDPPVIEGLETDGDPFGKKSPVQASSVDLAVGNVFLPETNSSELGSLTHPLDRYALKPGETAIVETQQSLHLTPTLAAFGFPPARVSRYGLLMTNPGHVDPGYNGTLKFTVINMARSDYTLRRGESIVTLLFFQLADAPQAHWGQRNPGVNATGVEPGVYSQLSRDFLDVKKRAEAVADQVESKSNRRTAWVGGVAAVVVAVIGTVQVFGVGGLASNDRVHDLERRVDVLEAQHAVSTTTTPAPASSAAVSTTSGAP